MLLNLKHFREAGGRPQLRVLHGEPDVRSGVERRRPRTGQPGTRRRSVNTIPPLVDERSESRNHNNMESDNNTGQVATVRGRQAGGARDDKDSNKPAHSTPFVAKHRKRVGLQVRALRRRFAVQKSLRDQERQGARFNINSHSKKKHHCNSTTSSGWLSRNSGLDESQQILARTTRPSRN